MKDAFGVDGIMIGRAAIGYPWIFNEIKYYLKTGKFKNPPSIKERVTACKRHLRHAISWKGNRLGVIETRRHYTNYFRGIPNFKPYKIKILTSENPNEILNLLDQVVIEFSDIMFD